MIESSSDDHAVIAFWYPKFWILQILRELLRYAFCPCHSLQIGMILPQIIYLRLPLLDDHLGQDVPDQ